MEDNTSRGPLRPLRALLNGVLAWFLGFALYVLPGAGLGFQVGYDRGTKGYENEEIGREVATAITDLYRGNIWLTAGVIIVTAGLIYWRARVVAGDTTGRGTGAGLLVAAIPAILAALLIVAGPWTLTGVLAVVAYMVAGIMGGRSAGTDAASPGAVRGT